MTVPRPMPGGGGLMRYVIAGYVFVLGILFLYAVQLAWRRRRLTRAVARVGLGRRGPLRRIAGDAGRSTVTTAPPRQPGRRPTASPTPARRPRARRRLRRRSRAPVALRGGRAWCWSARWPSSWSRASARHSTSTCRPTRPWPRGRPSATRPSTWRAWSSPGRSTPRRRGSTSSSPRVRSTSPCTTRAARPSCSSRTSRSSPWATSPGDGFVSDQILVKHTSTYIAQYPSRVTAPNGTKR